MSDPEHLSAGLAGTLESLRQSIVARAAETPAQPEKPRTAKVVQLPLWPETRRAAPNAVFRSALFPALKYRQGRPFLKNQAIASVGGVTVLFTGERFDQSDLDVYLEVLNLARFHPLGTECTFSAYGLLKTLGHATGNTNHKWLHAVLIRLRGSTIDITDHKQRYFGGLIQGGFKDEITKHYRIMIDSRFAAIFGYGMWSSIDRAQRHALGRNATAKALHAYYSTHAAPSAHSFDTLAAIVGLRNPNKRQERATLIKAHALLASEEVAFLRDYTVSGDARSIKVHIRPTPGQARHIARNAASSRLKRR
jgi:TrfA protein